jgi:ABC-type sugar transport system ATPase subunit
MESEAMRIISSLSVNIPSMRDAVDLLSGGQRQAIAIARATTWGNQVILMDEPTAALGVTETSRVEDLISKLRSKELAVVIVSHNLSQVFRISDSVVVMRQGQVAAIRKTSETNGDEVIRLITGLN